MAACSACNKTILFGGVYAGGYRFCGTSCRDKKALLLSAGDALPDAFVFEQTQKVHAGPCANCGGPGPIDFHTSHSVFSALVVTRWRSNSIVCCHSCGSKAKWKALLSSATLGWWGFPWGILITPVQIVRNVSSLVHAPDPRTPSDKMVSLVRGRLANQLLQESNQAS